MVRSVTQKSSDKKKAQDMGKILILTFFLLAVLWGLLRLFFPEHPKIQPRPRNFSQVKEESESHLPEQKENEAAFKIASEAFDSLEVVLKDLDRGALRFERDRVRGHFGSDGTGPLVKYWHQWAADFRQRFDQSAAEFDINRDDLERDLPTPVHVAYRLVYKLPFEISLAWEEGSGLEDLPARIEVGRAMTEARRWLENRGQ